MVWYCVECVVEAEAVRDRRPLVELDISSRSFEFRRPARCDNGMLLLFGLLSARALLLLSTAGVHTCFWGLYFGMRLAGARTLEESDVLFDSEGRDGAGEPDDRGCDTQSSDNESSHAPSIAIRWLVI